ncbi:helix-turn-helix transcriptional regulator [Escherichia coli]|uniref:helix-turn-helix domain-containing protein n=1 Tax=Escherichia coli TaxID=562 RepID=UPI00259597AC|nr:helix-turn-helix transcriptional regulator [Escherichia coli]MDM4037806.1 helix-turn-helix transcriptional regulator [Escherichia coli]
MSTKDNELDLLGMADESQVLSDLLSVIASAITQASGGINEIESCISIAWRISHSINENLLKLTRTAQAKSARSYKQNLAINSLNRLRTQREACGLTTAELARLLDLDEEMIIQWESGEYEPTISMLIPLANVLGCDPMWLLTGAYKQNQEEA